MEAKEIVAFLCQLARDAGTIMMSKRGSTLQMFRKKDSTLVTEVDLAISKMVVERVGNFAPHWGLMTEETCSGNCREHEIGLIVDELDGTNGYATGQGGFTFQCAFHIGGRIMISVIFDPVDNVLVYAIKGQGVWIEQNGTSRNILPSEFRCWDSLRFAHHRRYMTGTIRKMYARMSVPKQNIIPTGGIGSKIIDFVLGKVDVLIALNRNIQPWDWAPGKLILEELGYACSHLTGAPLKLFSTHQELEFGYLVCPQVHWNRFLGELSWITEKVMPNHLLLKIFREKLIPVGMQGNLSA